MILDVLKDCRNLIFRVKNSLTLEIKALQNLQRPGTIYPPIQCYIPEDLDLQQHHSENLKSHTDQACYSQVFNAGYMFNNMPIYNFRCSSPSACNWF
jgi:hypothetical protein